MCLIVVLVIWGLAFSFHHFDLSLFSTWYGYPLFVTSILLVIVIPLLVDYYFDSRGKHER